jgi:hypothetical protein
VDFFEARDLFGIIFQIPGPKCKIMDCRLISKKLRGLFAKFLKYLIFGFNFQQKIPWTESTAWWTADRAGPQWTADRGRSARRMGAGARRCSPVMEGEDEPVEAVLGWCSPVTEEWQRGGAPEATNSGGLSSSRGWRRARRSLEERG